ncbi:MAG TPA: hypothetical protein VKA94_01310 [Hyphomicrobiales bacterium]|nr:hypothetical protein [Hyphomicrobiales bacterium]
MNNDEKKSSLSNVPHSPDGKESKSLFSEHDYGMPNFAFPDDDLPDSFAKREPPRDTIAEVEANLDMPLSEGTGWESGESVNLVSISDETGMVTEPEVRIQEEEDFGDEPSPANVMPFPGSTIPRSSELEPSELLRGAEDTYTDDLLDEPTIPYSGPAEDYDSDEPDSIADAVQSALKNVYGNDSEAPADEPSIPDFGQFSVAESLRQDAAAQAAAQGAYWDDDEAAERDHGNPEGETETVLDYLYSNRRAGPERLQEPHTPPEEYSGYGATSLDSGAVYFDPQHDGQQGNYDEYEEDPDWSPPSFVTSSSPAQQHPGQYPAPMATAANPESLAVGTPDSSHLLGAAGLGLIGGIALAGVLAVFVFNSFVEENAPPVSATLSTSKVVERLGGEGNSGATVIASRGAAETAIPGPNIPPVQPEARSTSLQPPAAIQQPAPVITPPEPDKPLNAFDVAGLPGTEIPLNIKLSESASKEASLISLKGLDENSKLSTGIDVGAGQWLLPPARLDTLTVTAPESVTGTYDIEVQLLKDDAQTPMSDPVSFKLTVGQVLKQSERAETAETQVAGLSETNEEATQLVEVTEATPEIDTDPLTQLLIRDGNKLMREGDILGARRLYEQAVANGNPEAALAMGRSYDPSYFEKLPIQTGKPDPATAFQWYKQALDGGLVTARVKIDGLKQWLQQ